MNVYDMIDQYGKHLSHESKSGNTVRAYIADLRGLARGVRSDKIQEQVSDLEKSLEELQCAQSTRNRKIAALNGFVVFLSSKLSLELAVKLTHRKVNGCVEHLNTREEYDALVNETAKYADASRNHALLALIYLQGLRLNELTSLLYEDVGNKIIRIDGNSFELEAETRPVLRKYEGSLSRRDRTDKRPYFMNREREALQDRSIRRVIANIAGNAGVKANPRSLRWGYVSNLVHSDLDHLGIVARSRMTPERLIQVYNPLLSERHEKLTK